MDREDEIGIPGARYLGFGRLVFAVGISGAGTGSRFDCDPMTGGDQTSSAVGSDRHPALAGAPRGEGVNVHGVNGGRNLPDSAYRTLYAATRVCLTASR